MQNLCPNCGGPLSSDAICDYCLKEPEAAGSGRRTRILIAGVVLFALVGIAAIASITYLAISMPEERVSIPAVAPAAPSNPTGPGESAQSTQEAPAKTTDEDLALYSSAVEPLLSQTRTEMQGALIDIKEFIKTANRTKNPRETRLVIDNFRDHLKEREQRLSSLSNSLKTTRPPRELEREHERLSTGVAKYSTAIQGYISGLSAYSFEQIRASQNALEAADQEIKTAADEFKQALARVTLPPR